MNELLEKAWAKYLIACLSLAMAFFVIGWSWEIFRRVWCVHFLEIAPSFSTMWCTYIDWDFRPDILIVFGVWVAYSVLHLWELRGKPGSVYLHRSLLLLTVMLLLLVLRTLEKELSPMP